jgi:hypothetical protein
MAKGWKIIIGIISILLTIILLAGAVYFFWPWNKKFFDNADKEFKIPGLDTSFCPQGMTQLEGFNKILISGYMDDGSPSRFYVLDGETKEVEKYFTLNIDGRQYDGHAGGVASYASVVWTFSKEQDNKGYAFKFKANDVMNVEDGGEITIGEYNCFDTWNGADFAFVKDKVLWVGEFYREGNYETDSSHHVKTTSGETNPAIIYGFDIDESRNAGVKYSGNSPKPTKAISVRGLCQGIAVTSDGKFVMSTSYSVPNSNLYYYKDILSEETNDTLNLGLTSMPLWHLDDNALISSHEIPAMSEELIVKDNRVYILFESGCKKYKMYNRRRLDSVYSLPISYFEK